MSDRLLAEGTIRRFMKLANVDSLTDNFIQEMAAYKMKHADKHDDKKGKGPGMRHSEAEEPEADVVEEQEEFLDEQEEEVEMDLDADMDPDMGEPGEEMGAADMSLTEEEARLLISLGERLKEAMDQDEAGDDDEDAPELDDAMAGEEEEEEDEDEDLPPPPGGGGREVYENQDDLVQEILRRVTKRIVASRVK